MTEGWNTLSERTETRLPSRVRAWVGLETSMTDRIGAVAGCPVDVEVLGQARGLLHPDEQGFFDTASDRSGIVREVCLSARGVPLLVARTVFTSRRLEQHPTIVRLGNHALGSVLFAGGRTSPYTVREFIHLGPGSPLFALVRRRHAGAQDRYWARRTLFRLFDAPLLVTEIFLPELLCHPGHPVAERLTRN